MGGHDADLVGDSVFQDGDSVEEWIGVFDVILELLDQFFARMVQLGEGESKMFSLVFLLLVVQIPLVLAVEEEIFQWAIQLKYPKFSVL